MATAPDARAVAEAVARQSYGRLVARLAARTRDVAGAEDALADAFALALDRWPKDGVPEAPEAWLTTVARRRLIDAGRHRQGDETVANHLTLLAEERDETPARAGLAADDRLLLMFACAHPAIDQAIRAPLILQTILGFDAGRIGSAFLVAPATMGQRLVRAKAKIRAAGIPFAPPEPEDMRERLAAVLDAIYAIFSDGWADERDSGWAEEGIWLGRLVVSLLPDEPEAMGLLALMLHAEARRPARRDANGDYVPLTAQDAALWDAAAIDEAEELIRRASRLCAIGRFQLEAAVQSAHAVRRLIGRSDWSAIAALYARLSQLTGSPVVAINHAIAVAEAGDVQGGMAMLETLGCDQRLADYQPFWAARAELSARLGRTEIAATAYRRAIGLATDDAARRFLTRRLEALALRSV